MSPVLERDIERLADQERAKAGAIEEKIGIDAIAVLQLHALDEATIPAAMHRDDLAFDPPRALRLRALAQEPRVEHGVEMVGVGNLRQRRIGRRIAGCGHEPALRRRNGVQRIGADVLRAPRRLCLQPILVERQQAEIAADRAEAVDIAVADLAPVVELDA